MRQRATGDTQTTHSAGRHGGMGEHATHLHLRSRPPTVLVTGTRNTKVVSRQESTKVIESGPNEMADTKSIGQRKIKSRGGITKKDRQNFKQQKIREQNNIQKIENELKKWEKHKSLLGHILNQADNKPTYSADAAMPMPRTGQAQEHGGNWRKRRKHEDASTSRG